MTQDVQIRVQNFSFLLEESLCSFHQHGSADRQGALVEVEFGMMKLIALVPFFLRTQREHCSWRVFHELAKILRAESLLDLVDVVGTEQVCGSVLNDL